MNKAASPEALAKFIADRLVDEDRVAREQGSRRDLAGIRFARWLLDEWTLLRAEADKMRRLALDNTNSEYMAASVTVHSMSAFYEPAIQRLAAVWDAHPDYRSEWAPR